MRYDKKFKEKMYYEFKKWVEDIGYTMISEPHEYQNAKSKLEMLCPENHHISINRNNWTGKKICFMCNIGYKDVNGKRKCAACKKWLDIDQYHKGKNACKSCRLEYQRSEKGKKEQQKRNRKWERSEKGITFYKKNKISRRISASIRESLNGHSKNNIHWEELVGYTFNEFKMHMESLFVDGMTWKNHGNDGWHIDHIRPVSSFDITSYNCDDFKKCWSLNNLQPLWSVDNIRKGNKWNGIINL